MPIVPIRRSGFHRPGRPTVSVRLNVSVTSSEIAEAMAWQAAHREHPLAMESAEACAFALRKHRANVAEKRLEAAKEKAKAKVTPIA